MINLVFRSLGLLCFLGLTVQNATALAEAGELHVLVTVDWEGLSLSKKNISAISSFQEKYPEIPMLHFLNAAYFTADEPGVFERFRRRISGHSVESFDHSRALKQIQKVVREIDEVGVHIHPSRQFVESAGVEFKETGFFSERSVYASMTPGYGTRSFLFNYTAEEQYLLLKFAKETLESLGFETTGSFRAGGWTANQDTFSALARAGYSMDSSATPPGILNGSQWENSPLQRALINLWPEIRTSSQPFVVPTSNGFVLEVPNNAGAADYWDSVGLINEIAAANIEFALAPNNRPTVVTLNFHQESSDQYISRLENMIFTLEKLSKEKAVNLKYTSFEQLKKIWLIPDNQCDGSFEVKG